MGAASVRLSASRAPRRLGSDVNGIACLRAQPGHLDQRPARRPRALASSESRREWAASGR